MAVASKTLKITHLDLASKYSWAQLGASGGEAWPVFGHRTGSGRGGLGAGIRWQGFVW